MRCLALSDEHHIGLEYQVARSLHPGEVEGVTSGPHVLAAAREGVAFAGRVVLGRPGMQDDTYVPVFLENAKRRLRRRGRTAKCGGRRAHERNYKARPLMPLNSNGLLRSRECVRSTGLRAVRRLEACSPRHAYLVTLSTVPRVLAHSHRPAVKSPGRCSGMLLRTPHHTGGPALGYEPG